MCIISHLQIPKLLSVDFELELVLRHFQDLPFFWKFMFTYIITSAPLSKTTLTRFSGALGMISGTIPCFLNSSCVDIIANVLKFYYFDNFLIVWNLEEGSFVLINGTTDLLNRNAIELLNINLRVLQILLIIFYRMKDGMVWYIYFFLFSNMYQIHQYQC